MPGIRPSHRLSVCSFVLAGPIPAKLGNLAALVELNLWGNQLSGESLHAPISWFLPDQTTMFPDFVCTRLSKLRDIVQGSIPKRVYSSVLAFSCQNIASSSCFQFRKSKFSLSFRGRSGFCRLPCFPIDVGTLSAYCGKDHRIIFASICIL